MPPDTRGDYFRAISRVPLLTPDKEVELAHQVQAMIRIKDSLSEASRQDTSRTRGNLSDLPSELSHLIRQGQRAKQQMIRANLKLVIMIAKQYRGKGLSLDDLIQEGALGLNRAVEKFDPTKGFKFSTYAYYWIRQAMARALSEKSRNIRLPVHVNEKLTRIKKIQRQLSQELMRTPTLKEVAERVKLDPPQMAQLLNQSRKMTSLDLLVCEDTELIDLLPCEVGDPKEVVEYADLQQTIGNMLSKLTPTQAIVLIGRYGLNGDKPQSLSQIGQRLNLSQKQVHQIERKTLMQLRRRWGRKVRCYLSARN